MEIRTFHGLKNGNIKLQNFSGFFDTHGITINALNVKCKYKSTMMN